MVGVIRKVFHFMRLLSAPKIFYKEVTQIIFTGVDLTSYGHDLPGKPKLGNIIKRLLTVQPKLKRLRLSSIDPAEIDSDLLQLLCYEKDSYLTYIYHYNQEII